jgi:hypothetical protein
MSFGLPIKNKTTTKKNLELDNYGLLENISSDKLLGLFIRKTFSEQKTLNLLKFKTSLKHSIKVKEKIIKLNFSNVINIESYIKDDVALGTVSILRKDNAAFVFFTGKEMASIDAMFYDDDQKEIQDVLDDLKKYSKVLKVDKNKRTVYVLGKSGNGFTLKQLPKKVDNPFQPDHYSKSVNDKIDLIKKEFSKKEPCGRLTILTGVPGSGKTHLVKSILSEIDMRYIFVPPNLIESISDPEFISTIIDNYEDDFIGYDKSTGEPIYDDNNKNCFVLVIEDADAALIDRTKHSATVSLKGLSNILNLGDGIVGSLIDIRILATTNYKKEDLDPAILRNGRLLTCIECNYISYDQCKAIWNKNFKKEPFYTKEELDKIITENYTLANLYSLINFYKREGRKMNEQDKD